MDAFWREGSVSTLAGGGDSQIEGAGANDDPPRPSVEHVSSESDVAEHAPSLDTVLHQQEQQSATEQPLAHQESPPPSAEIDSKDPSADDSLASLTDASSSSSSFTSSSSTTEQQQQLLQQKHQGKHHHADHHGLHSMETQDPTPPHSHPHHHQHAPDGTAAERDHRRVGMVQKLFFFHELSPGSAFFLPHGARIYNGLQNFIRKQYRKRGYEEVITPNVFNNELWKISGHYDHYKDDMFMFEVEGQEYGMKPMNCPGHCLMFRSALRSYKELPIRFADFGVLHRNELSGTLTGLTRVRRFQQDDSHIFARCDQIEAEVAGVLDMIQECYQTFGFSFELVLSTRPEKFLGQLEVWDQAEVALAQALNKFGQAWTLNPGDGAFYGPKIDVRLLDSLHRKHQCATVQLDFQLPLRFGLTFKAEGEGFETPVIIHRAILGSVERMFAILTEHTAGKWPFWISPRQIMIIPVAEKYLPYALEVRALVHKQGYFVEVDSSSKQLAKKVREAELLHFNLILVVGEEEKEHRCVHVRLRDSLNNNNNNNNNKNNQCVWSLDELSRQCKQFIDRHL